MKSPYFTVKYETTHGTSIRHFFVPEGTYFEPEKWVICIKDVGNEVRYDLMQEEDGEVETEGSGRTIYVVNMTRTAFAGKNVNNLFMKTLQNIRPQLTEENIITLDSKPIDKAFVTLKDYLSNAVLVTLFGLKSDKFSEEELNNIEEYVHRGGRIIISSDAPWDPPNKLAEAFGIEFGSERISDPEHHEGKHNDHIIVTEFADHPLNNEVNFICFGDYGCHPITVREGEYTAIASSSSKTLPPETAVASLIRYYEGEVLVIGQTCLFDGNYLDMDGFDNRLWFENMVQYMTRVDEEGMMPHEPEKSFQKLSQKFCHHCGKELEESFHFCGYCGAQKVELDIMYSTPQVETPVPPD
jgi:hypothetical protein